MKKMNKKLITLMFAGALCAATMGVRGAQRVLSVSSFFFLLLLWITAVYFLLKAADGLSLFCFSLSLFLRFFDEEKT